MFAADTRMLARLEPTVRRTLIVEPNLHAARLLVDIIKGLGARDIHVEQSDAKAMIMARELEPGLIFTGLPQRAGHHGDRGRHGQYDQGRARCRRP